MKKLLLTAIAVYCALVSFAQVPILYYDFEPNASRSSNGEVTPEFGVNNGNSNFLQKDLAGFGYTNGAGALYGGNAGRAVTAEGWPVLNFNPGASASRYFQFTVNTQGFSGLSLSFEHMRGFSGPQAIGVTYSIDGVNFTTLPSKSTDLSYTSYTEALPAQAENRSAVTIRIYGYFSVTTVANLSIDNVEILASTITGVKTILIILVFVLLPVKRTRRPLTP